MEASGMADDSAKQGEGAELSKDVLAPSDGPRENLVATAVKFLQNPKVRQSPLSQKKTFLESKGLTSDEIQLAVQRAGVTDEPQPSQNGLLPSAPPQAFNGAALVPAQQPLPPPLPVSPWTKTREIVTTAAIVAAVSYAVYNVFKTYIRPWLMGKSETENRMQRLETSVAQLQASVAESNAQMVEILKAIQESLTVQKERNVQSSEVSLRQESHALNEIKLEISSLKALLLNRRQFPAPPVTSPIIPAWQKSAVINSQTQQASTGQPESDGGQDGVGTVAEQSSPLPADTDAETAKMQSAEDYSQYQPPPLEGDTAASPSTSSSNGFEMIKPSSNSDTAADLD
ncbi:peroxisomal membrane protein PEX14-like [Babylonia areolata]|uniref:peroxisomal membrane protein PEX14-like n=1 Tax=Babylonia areolata TaxID=304850 RepID=UPI003FD0B477